MNCARFKVGYAGQKYAVVIDDPTPTRLGWINKPDGGSLMKMAKAHPHWKHCNPRVVEVKDDKGNV